MQHKHTLYTDVKKHSSLVRQQLKTSALTGHFWCSLLPSFVPAWPEAPQEGLPSSRDKELSSGLSLPIATANAGKEEETESGHNITFCSNPKTTNTTAHTEAFKAILQANCFCHTHHNFCNHLLVPKLHILTPLLTRRDKANTKFWISLGESTSACMS